MASKSDDIPWWGIVLVAVFGGLIGAAAIQAEADRRARKVVTYRCHQCDKVVEPGVPACPRCGAEFEWPQAAS